jgi:hypothetical protein
MDLQAETIASQVVIVGKGGRSAFGEDSILETVNANVLKKPFTPSELNNLIAEALQGKDARILQQEIIQDYEAYIAGSRRALSLGEAYGRGEMSKYLRSREARVVIGVGVVLLAIVGAFMIQRTALASVYTNPFWTNSSSALESPLCDVAGVAMVCESTKCGAGGAGCGGNCGGGCHGEKCCDVTVDARTGELFFDKVLFTTAGLLGQNGYAIRWRSMVGGASQLGRQVLPSWETTANKVIVNSGNPNATNGHYVDIRRPSGRIDTYWWGGRRLQGRVRLHRDRAQVLRLHGGAELRRDDGLRQDGHDHPGRQRQPDRRGVPERLESFARPQLQ